MTNLDPILDELASAGLALNLTQSDIDEAHRRAEQLEPEAQP